jgi:hypothetical protein
MPKNHDIDSKTHCETCGAQPPGYDSVHYGSFEDGYRLLCTVCFNAEVAAKYGLDDFENVRFEQIAMTDCAGEAHEFHFRTRLLGTMVVLSAFELKQGANTDCKLRTRPFVRIFLRTTPRMSACLYLRSMVRKSRGTNWGVC